MAVPGDFPEAFALNGDCSPSLDLDFQAVFMHSANPAIIFTPVQNPVTAQWDLRIDEVNKAYVRVFWNGDVDHRGRRLSDQRPDLPLDIWNQMKNVVTTGEPLRGEAFIAWHNRWFGVHLFRSEAGKLVAILRETTEQERQRKLADQEQLRFQAFFEMGAVKLIVDALTGRICDVNPPAERFYGWSRIELKGRRIDEIYPRSLPALRTEMGKVASGEIRFIRSRHRVRSGALWEVEVHASYGVWSADRVIFLVVFPKSEVPGPRIPALGVFASRLEPRAPFIRELVNSLAAIGKSRRFRRGEPFLRAGDEATMTGVSAQGFFRSYLVDDRGEEVSLGFFRPGQLVASHSSLVETRPSVVTIEALNPCEVYVMDSLAFFRVISSNPLWFQVLYLLLEPELFLREKREISLLSLDARTRYHQFLADFPDLIPFLRNFQIASYLGVSPETLSRIRSSENPVRPVL